ncbi:MAG: DUF116 domain-containing protein [Bacillota bacterium]|nr:DUF116 domain-containing protein [Bacillota bacterium]
MNIKKRIFIGLIGVTLFAFLMLMAVIWLLIMNEVNALQNLLLISFGAISTIFIFVVGLGLIALVWSLWHAKPIPTLQTFIQVTTDWLFPFALKIGKIFGIDQDTIKSSFIEVNNQLVQAKMIKVEPKRLLILAPHCLQKSNCPHKITVDVSNCQRCGKCCVNGLLDISKKYGVKVVVATGGTFARKFIMEFRPKAIIAIACERDLTTGIQDTGTLPVIGIINIRPEGPCWNTVVNIAKVEEAVAFLTHSNNLLYNVKTVTKTPTHFCK